MRLYLSSENVGNYSDQLLEMVGDNKTVAYIGNAKDDWDNSEKSAKVAEHKALFEALGFNFTEFDLKNYFGAQKITKEDLVGFGLVWCSGGNTFLLRRALADSGLDQVLVKMLKNNEIVYGGSSAGSIIPTPSLKGAEFGDDPGQVEKIYKKEIIWEGLNLVPFHIVPHYKTDWFRDDTEKMISYLKDNSHNFTALKDGQVVLVYSERHETLL